MRLIEEAKRKPFVSKLSFQNVPARDVFEFIPQSLDKLGKNKSAEEEALLFYLLNHAWGLVQLNPEKYSEQECRKVIKLYNSLSHTMFVRMYHYLLLICTRESRHVHSGGKKDSVMAKFPDFKSFHKYHVNDTSSKDKVKEICENVPDVDIVTYCEWLVEIFKCSFSGGYGGPAWRKIAQCVLSFVKGDASPEMTLDTAWTLSHNNGPIFNKGMLYSGYNTHELMKVLDVQASGQVPQLIAQEQCSAITADVEKTYDDLHAIFGSSFEGVVNWDEVEKSSKKKLSYSKYKKKGIKSGQYLQVNNKETVKILSRSEI